jgi:hypothetical protein
MDLEKKGVRDGSAPGVWPTMLLAAKRGAGSTTLLNPTMCGQRCCWLTSVALVVPPLYPTKTAISVANNTSVAPLIPLLIKLPNIKNIRRFCRPPIPLLIQHPNIKKI